MKIAHTVRAALDRLPERTRKGEPEAEVVAFAMISRCGVRKNLGHQVLQREVHRQNVNANRFELPVYLLDDAVTLLDTGENPLFVAGALLREDQRITFLNGLLKEGAYQEVVRHRFEEDETAEVVLLYLLEVEPPEVDHRPEDVSDTLGVLNQPEEEIEVVVTLQELNLHHEETIGDRDQVRSLQKIGNRQKKEEEKECGWR
ncbi:hypothetical protein B9Z55_001933 [Caenorhabditis nigoni]|uniref:Uncharacterized protein n=1 Tax=Caenorhabditis nigoni TaxID=1611254 RepID=A0A2G5VIC5_9PELO|nr:hypothetical protein B9Z55_001933 [Caenorhabditis nigoni]